MKTALCSMIAGASMLALAGGALANEPVALTELQMDGVTAGISSIGSGYAAAFGDLTADTYSVSASVADAFNRFAFATAQNTSLAVSALFAGVAEARSTAAAAH